MYPTHSVYIRNVSNAPRSRLPPISGAGVKKKQRRSETPPTQMESTPPTQPDLIPATPPPTPQIDSPTLSQLSQTFRISPSTPISPVLMRRASTPETPSTDLRSPVNIITGLNPISPLFPQSKKRKAEPIVDPINNEFMKWLEINDPFLYNSLTE